MSAETELPAVSLPLAEDLRNCIAVMRRQIIRLTHSAEMLRDGTCIPSWDEDVAIPTQRLNSSLFFIESLLRIEESPDR